MSKTKRKRTKRYTGESAAQPSVQPEVYRIKAVDRGRLGQWWFERKKVIKPIAAAGGVIALIIWLIVELVRLAV